jgi:hypothetical protein
VLSFRFYYPPAGRAAECSAGGRDAANCELASETRPRLALNEAAKIDYTPHPTDDSLVIGENGHTYAATCLPESGWQFAEAWDILDQLKPDSIPINVRLWLAGIIAGALDRVAKERSMSAFDLRD